MTEGDERTLQLCTLSLWPFFRARHLPFLKKKKILGVLLSCEQRLGRWSYSFGWDLHRCNRSRDLDRELKNTNTGEISPRNKEKEKKRGEKLCVSVKWHQTKTDRVLPWRPPPPPGPAPQSAGRLWAEQWLSAPSPCLQTNTSVTLIFTPNSALLSTLTGF